MAAVLIHCFRGQQSLYLNLEHMEQLGIGNRELKKAIVRKN